MRLMVRGTSLSQVWHEREKSGTPSDCGVIRVRLIRRRVRMISCPRVFASEEVQVDGRFLS